MAMSARQVKALLREKGWKAVDLAAHWGYSISYVSWLVNHPLDRSKLFEDALRGLLPRSEVEVKREDRHIPKPRDKAWQPEEMYPDGRVFITLDSRLGPEEGTELVVVGRIRRADGLAVQFRVLSGDATGDLFEVRHGPEADHLHDTGQTQQERQAMAFG